jgi:hypothetical protein
MKLKTKAQMTGRELCDLEGVIFPYLADMDKNDQDKAKKAAVNMVNDNWEFILSACYLNDDGTMIEDTEVPARMMILQDFDKIIGFVMGSDEKKPEGETTPRPIKRR